jgi:hypothetical protein
MLEQTRTDFPEALPPTNGFTADDFDFDAMTLPQTYTEMVVVQEVLTQVPVRKAKKDEYFRVHTDPLYAMDYIMVERDQTLHPILPALVHLVGEDSTKRYKLYTAVTSKGRLFLFPAELPNAMGELNAFAKNYHVICQKARTHWTRMVWSDSERRHKTEHIEHEREPVFPDLQYREIIKLAFADTMITSPDHPVIKFFQGKEIF